MEIVHAKARDLPSLSARCRLSLSLPEFPIKRHGPIRRRRMTCGVARIGDSAIPPPLESEFRQDSVEFPIRLRPLLLGLLQEHDSLL